AGVPRDRRPQLRDARRRRIVGVAGAERRRRRVDDVGRRVEIGLTDLQVDDLPSLGLEGARSCEHLERRLRPQPAHPFGQLHCRLLAFVDYWRGHYSAPWLEIFSDTDPIDDPTERPGGTAPAARIESAGCRGGQVAGKIGLLPTRVVEVST